MDTWFTILEEESITWSTQLWDRNSLDMGIEMWRQETLGNFFEVVNNSTFNFWMLKCFYFQIPREQKQTWGVLNSLFDWARELQNRFLTHTNVRLSVAFLSLVSLVLG